MTDLLERIASLSDAARLSSGRVDSAVTARVQQILDRASYRLSRAGEWTVVALAGSTGSGKSSLFNAIVGTEMAPTGVLRPTTAEAMAAVWGSSSPTDLLAWLDVPHSTLIVAPDNDYTSLVLLDLPDHDSTETTHKEQVDRLVDLADMFVWVVDPQKYADAALHEGYLKPMVSHCDVMAVALNQTDLLTEEQTQDCLSDLRALLDREGLSAAPVFAVSAATGRGVTELGQHILRAVRDKQMTWMRFSADVTRAATDLAHELGTSRPPVLDRHAGRELTDALVAAAGGEVFVEAVEKTWRLRGGFATGWPMVSWIGRFRADPLTRLHSGQTRLADESVPQTSSHAVAPVYTARVDQAIRELSQRASAGLPPTWSVAVREAANRHRALLLDKLDTAIARTDLRLDRGPVWWSAVRFVQWVLIIAALVGAVWIGANAVLGLLGLPQIPVAMWRGLTVPALLVSVGAVCGIVLAFACRVGIEVGARRKAVRARLAIRKAVAEVAAVEIVNPVATELERYQQARRACDKAR